MTAQEMELIAQAFAAKHGRSIEYARAAFRNAMCEIAREAGMPEAKIQAYLSAVGR